MAPDVWRKKKGLSLRKLAALLGCAWSSVRRWESGETEAPNSVVLAYERESKDEDGTSQVTGADLNRVRKRYLRAQGIGTSGAQQSADAAA